MPLQNSASTRPRVLDPADRISEVLFGLIMVLTFTGSLSVAEAGRDDVRTMLIGALGCNLAWGIIDGVFYLMGCLAEKGRDLQLFRTLRRSADPAQTRDLLADALPKPVRSVLLAGELDSMAQRLKQLPEPPEKAHLTATEWKGALGVFLLVFLSTLPVAIPFMLFHTASTAMRISNLVAIAMLFGAGAAYGRCVGRSPALVGMSMVALGAALVGLTIALGG